MCLNLHSFPPLPSVNREARVSQPSAATSSATYMLAGVTDEKLT